MNQTKTNRLAMLAGLLTAAAIAAAPIATLHAGTPAGPKLGIDANQVKANYTREQWMADAAAGLYSLVGHRVIAWSTGNARLEISDGTHDGSSASHWSAVVSAAGVTLQSAYTTGNAILVTSNAPIAVTNTTTNGTGDMTLDASGIVAGANTQSVLTVTQSAGNTTSGTVRLADFNFTGTVGGGTAQGIRITVPSASNDAIKIPVGSITLDSGNETLTSGNLTLTSGNETLSAGTYTQTYTGTSTAHGLTANSITTGKAVSVVANGITQGDVYYGESSAAGFTTGKFVRFNDGAQDVFTVAKDGATVITGTSSGTAALTLTAGDVTITSGALNMTSGNETLTAGDLTLSAGLLSVTPSATTTRGLLVAGTGARNISLISSTNTGNFTSAANVFSSTGAPSAAVVSVTGSGAGSGDLVNATNSSAGFTGDVGEFAVGTATAGRALNVLSTAAARTTTLAKFTETSTSSGSTIEVDMKGVAGTGVGFWMRDSTGAAGFNGNGMLMDMTGWATTALGLAIDGGGRAWTGGVGNINVPLYITSTGGGAAVNAYELINVTTAGAATSTNHAIDVVVGAVDWRGAAYHADTGATATSAKGFVMTHGASARNTAANSITDSGTGSGRTVSVAKSAGSGEAFYVQTTGTNTSSALRLVNTSANTQSMFYAVDSGVTANDGRSFYLKNDGAMDSAAAESAVATIVASGAWVDATNRTSVLHLVHSGSGTAAATPRQGDMVLTVEAQGANVEGLYVQSGLSFFDEGVQIGTPGTGPGTYGLVVNPAPGSQGIVIDASTAGQRPTHGNGVLNIPITSSTASVLGINLQHTLGADVTGNIGVAASMTTPGAFLTGTNQLDAFRAGLTGQNNASETGTVVGYDTSFSSFNAAATTVALDVSGTHTYTVSSKNTPIVITPRRTSNSTGPNTTVTGGQGLGAGNAGGTLALTGGAGASATTGGAGGDTNVTAGAANGDGTVDRNGGTLTLAGGAAVTAGAAVGGPVVIKTGAGGTTQGTITLGIGGTTNKVTYDTAASAGGLGGINTVAAAGTMRPTRAKFIPAEQMYSYTVATATSLNGFGTKAFTDAALGTDIVTFGTGMDSCIDVSADMSIVLVWTAAAGSGTDTMWKVSYKNIADNGATTAAFVAIADTADTLTANNEEERTGAYTITGGTLAASDHLSFEVRRDGAAGGDSSANTSNLLGAIYTYRSLCN